ncbi:hypothetical protein K466DRAFT_195010 [Polyporus arcularius HHB13444]|uniref:Fungal-type protein kinase domain-containing protein n=1 Tax=Polyporus arcularius HHB13444 TaxID=1314778 RepID=A0A5C3PWC2_9APHY|nr:hypothetical protein K466DRAFT_195010 [Polyporus arcularius HHB13444]
MEYNLKQVTLESFLKDYLPGHNIPKKHLKNLHYPADLSSETKEWKINTAICRLANSVTSCKKPTPPNGKKDKSDNSGDYPLVTLDISNWSPKAPGNNADAAADSGDADGSGEAGEADKVGEADKALDPDEDPSDPDADLKTATRVDVGVFFKNDRFKDVVSIPPEDFMKKSRIRSKEDKEERKNYVGRCSWADVVVPIEVKINTQKSAFYFEDDPTKFLRTDSNDGREALGQLGEYIGQVFGHQHRVHLYAVYVYKDRARLLYFERQGALVSEPFKYGTRKDLTLHTFFWRLANMSREQLGFDPTVTPADADVVAKMREYAPHAPTDYIEQQIYRALSVDPKQPNVSTSSQWPPYELKMCGRRYLIARPTFASPALYGRCTRGYLAYDIDGEDGVRFIKDSWRLDLKRVQPEHEVYERLEREGVTHGVVTCLGHEDVPNPDGSRQLTRIHQLISPSRPARVHYRLLIRQVCRPLTDFADFEELTNIICEALIAHRDAWKKARVLHRDVSVSNIMIYEEGRGSYVVRYGMLCDWDLCKYQEQMSANQRPRTIDRTGTWYFRSALALLFPGKPYELADDIESFVHVYHYCVLRFHVTNRTHNLANFVQDTYDFVRVRESDGAHIGGLIKLEHMQLAKPPMRVGQANPVLDQFLFEIAELCSKHYSTINIENLQKTYDPPEKVDLEYQKTPREKKAWLYEEYNATQAATKRTRLEFEETQQGTETKSPGVAATPPDLPPLKNHDALVALFLRYTLGKPDAHGRSVRWPMKSTKCEDLFKGAGVAPRKDNNFSSSYPSHGYSQDHDEPPTKKRKGGDGASLPGVEESVEEGVEE